VRANDIPGWVDDGDWCWDCGETVEGKGVEVEIGKCQGARVVATVCEGCWEMRREFDSGKVE